MIPDFQGGAGLKFTHARMQGIRIPMVDHIMSYRPFRFWTVWEYVHDKRTQHLKIIMNVYVSVVNAQMVGNVGPKSKLFPIKIAQS